MATDELQQISPSQAGWKQHPAVRRITMTLIGFAAAIAAVFGVVPPVAAADQVPEYYQFCHDRVPQQGLTVSGTRTQRVSASDRYWYKNARAHKDKVECMYMTAWMGFIPKDESVYWSWNQVCQGMRLGKVGYMGSDKLPYCK